MATQIDWCSRCAASLYLEDGVPGGCGCPEGQLKQLLANIRQPQKAPVSRPVVASRPSLTLQDVQNTIQGIVTAATVQPKQRISLESLWSTEPGGEEDGVTASVDSDGLEDLWMGRVAQETGQHMGTGNLESLWMNELSTPGGTTAANVSEEITFDQDGFFGDIDLDRGPRSGGSSYGGSYRSASRVVGQAGRFQILREAPEPAPVPVRQPRMTIQEVRAQAIARSAPPEPPPRRSAVQKAIEYSSRRTAYQRLMSDD